MTREVSELGAEPVKQYAYRDAFALDKAGGYYVRHVQAMTAEQLHSKADIAAELAWRDQRADRLAERLERAREWMRHDDDCDGLKQHGAPYAETEHPCDCGLTAFLDSMTGEK